MKTTTLLAAILVGVRLGSPQSTFSQSTYIAHEWGTFTSVQGADGKLLSWQSQQVAELPKFVYTSATPGLGRSLLSAGGKVVMPGFQRMETPVIYFYSSQEQTVDVSVKFPKGYITEWYPQADRIGPSFMATATQPIAPLHSSIDSRIEWNGVKILPSHAANGAGMALPMDGSQNHYFAARETDAALLAVNSFAPDGSPEWQQEKFLFYRGIGSFITPLVVTMQGGELTVSNAGPDALPAVFIFSLHEGRGSFLDLGSLQPGESRTAPCSGENPFSTDDLSTMRDAIAAQLTAQSLYTREAAAMVNTWKDSWLAEDGVRVLYLLPRPWTDAILPVNFNPAPGELVRVMVGRAEVITPALESKLRDDLILGAGGDAAARERAAAAFKKLGRFGGAAWQLAARGLTPKQLDAARDILFPPPPPGVAGNFL
jgi:hypothetical protein